MHLVQVYSSCKGSLYTEEGCACCVDSPKVIRRICDLDGLTISGEKAPVQAMGYKYNPIIT